MRKGPRPKPTVIKKRAGNPGKRRLNAHEAHIPPEVPKCPSHILGEARREWKRISVKLYEEGLLTGVDRAALAFYCQTWAVWVEAEQKLKKLGRVVRGVNGTLKRNPWCTISKQAADQCLRYIDEFGMSPASRSHVQATDMMQKSLADLLFEKAKLGKS
jgi:P27 family predicted phage terminase small subunit